MNLSCLQYTGSVTEAARDLLAPFLKEGDWVVDATVGLGRDCVELAAAVGPAGRVMGVDLQAAAVESASEHIAEAALDQVKLVCGCHSDWSSLLPWEWKGRVKAFVYNLGYLPGSDHAVTTQAGTTLRSIENAAQWVCPGGVIRVVAYRGHPGGSEEYRAVRSLLAKLGPARELHSVTGSEAAPALFLLTC